MPNITIKEQDLTTPGGVNASSNIVYVPGFAKYGEVGTYLFNTVNEFKEKFKNPTDNKFYYLKYSTDATHTAEGNTPEKSQLYALSILQTGLPVLFDCLQVETSGVYYLEDEYAAVIKSKLESSQLNILKDRNNYNIKFLTTGGYSNIHYKDSLLSTASLRGDCTALIDHEEMNSKYDITSLDSNETGKFGALFTPWCSFKLPSHQIGMDLESTNMPGSLAYLLAFASSVSTNNANWLAAAGASRGAIPYLNAPLVYLTEADINTYSKHPTYRGVSVNPIARINPYGVIVWGNRTLFPNPNGLVASSFLNIRQLTNDIKKTIYAACKGITFEQNSDLLWIKFKSLVTPLLDQMQTGDGISGYELKKKKSTGKATLTAVVRIYPIEAVEDFDITVELADEATTVEG